MQARISVFGLKTSLLHLVTQICQLFLRASATITELTHVFTTPEGLKLVQNTHYAAVDTIAYHTVMLPHAFEADCGFQTLGWLGHLLEDTSICDALTSGDRQWIPPMSSQAAVLWRGSFENHLFLQGKAKTLISPFALRVGGAFPQDSPEARVEQLLIQHGVPILQNRLNDANKLLHALVEDQSFRLCDRNKIGRSSKLWPTLSSPESSWSFHRS